MSKLLNKQIKTRKFDDRETMEVEQRFENQNCADKHSHDSTRLRLGAWKGVQDRAAFCGIDVTTEYFYESGRSSRHDTMVKFTPTECREIANHLLKLADYAEKEA